MPRNGIGSVREDAKIFLQYLLQMQMKENEEYQKVNVFTGKTSDNLSLEIVIVNS